jgi:gliding motility-associated-like protein
MLRKLIFLLLFLSLYSFKNYATHIVGGEIYYDYLGGDNYKITLKVYRDCNPNNAAFDNPAYIFIFNSAGNIVDSMALELPETTILPPVINNPCFTPPTDVCVEEAIYEGIINLPPIPGGYDLSYQRCCRNHSIVNIVDPGNVGSAYMAHIPGSNQVAINSSPRYSTLPPIFICQGVPLIFNHAATDPDGDSLYYELCDPVQGGTQMCASYSPSDPNCSDPPPPPYDIVPWESGYTADYPMSASPVMSINHTTGLLTGTPNMLGQYVVAVCVSEYRNGVLLDINKRDFQFNVTVCPNLPVASIPLQTQFCFGNEMHFTQNSLNADSYHWDFGDLTTNADVSAEFAPSWVYPDTGIYTVTLIINPGSLCADTNTILLHIQNLLQPSFVPPPAQCAHSLNFNAGGLFSGNGTFSWDFGSHATPVNSTAQNPTNIQFDTAGTYPVTLTIHDNGCTESYTDSVQIIPKPEAYFGLQSPISCVLNPVQFLDSTVSATSLFYQWDLGNGSTSNLQNPITTYSSTGTYNVSLIVTTPDGCKDTVELPASLTVLPPPVASFTSSPNCLNYMINFEDTSVGSSTFLWNFGDWTTLLDVSNQDSTAWTYPDSGSYTVTLIINPGSACTDTSTMQIHFPHFLDPRFVPPAGQCVDNNSFNFNGGGFYFGTGTFNWNFGSNATPSSSTAENPTGIVFHAAGSLPVTFTVSENGCMQSYTDYITVYPKPVANFSPASTLNCALNAINFVNSSTGDAPLSYLWDFDNGSNSTLQNPSTTYSSVGTYDVNLIVTSQYGCKDTVELPSSLSILPPPVPSFGFITNCFSNLINFTQSSIGASSYLWDFGDLTTSLDASNIASPTWTYPDSGIYSVTMTVNPGTSCIASQTNSIHLNRPLIPTFAAPPGECIDGNSFDFIPHGSYMGNGTFSWTFGPHSSPSTGNIENPVNIVYDTVGTFPVSITISENGCTVTKNDTVQIFPKPEAHFEITTPFGCTLNPVYFIDDSYPNGHLTYLWNFGNGDTSIVQNPNVTYQDEGNYTVSLFITDTRTCKDTYSFPAPLIVHPSPVAGFIVTPTYTSVYYPDISLVDQSSGADLWEVNWADSVITYDQNSVHSYTEAGTFNIMQIVENNFGCYDTAYSQVLIDANYLFWLPNAFTPGGINDLNDIFKPKVAGVHKYSFMIFNRWGEKLFETQNLSEGWNGYYKNNLCEQDVYVYRISFWDDEKSVYHEYMGSVTLVR